MAEIMSSDAKKKMPSPHAIVFPYPYQGHITPTVNLAINLASKGFTITYVQLEFVHHTITSKACGRLSDDKTGVPDPFAEARKTGLDIRYTTISDGFPVEFDRDVNFNEYWETMILDFPGRVDELVGGIIMKSDQERAAATRFFLVADCMYSWPATIATKHNLVNVSLCTEATLVFSTCYHLDLLRQNGHLPYTAGDDGVDLIDYIPGVESISTKDLITCFQDPDAIPALIKIVVKAFEQVKNADFILCNTVQELESDCLSALNQKQPIYAIGPINFAAKITVGTSLLAESDCTDNWLRSKPPGSVLYISFGSIAEIDKHDIREIAHGLVLSQVHFIWVMRNTDIKAGDDSSNDVFPVGFEDVLKERGLLVRWCDQNAVLSDPSVGGFVTHCGWNSILESVWNCVPMVCYPFFVDQTTNRKLVVDDWKVGVNLCDGSGRVTRDEVASKIGMLMRGKTCAELKEEMTKLSKIMRNALDTADGSSQRNFDQFVRDLKAAGRNQTRMEQ